MCFRKIKCINRFQIEAVIRWARDAGLWDLIPCRKHRENETIGAENVFNTTVIKY